jgi:hypothetical protein
VCAVTAFTGTSCGRVTQVGYPNPGDFAIADYCTQPGDSGGAVVNNHIALGIHFGNFGAACGVSAYVGINEAQQVLNVRVVTA